MCAEVVNSVGLFLDIVGVILLFRYGLPPEGVSRTGGTILHWGTDKETREKAREKRRHYEFLSWSALGFLVTGFILQIVSNFL